MFSISKTANSNYLAKVIRLNNLRKHNNADRLQVVTIDGNNVITDLKAKEGDVYVFFPLECTLNKEFLSWSNSFEDSSQNKNNDVKGFFNKHGRVRAIKLRGEKSEGYIVPLNTFKDWLLSKNLKIDFTEETVIGVEFDSYNDIIICKKYIPKISLTNGSNSSKKGRIAKVSRLVDNQFRFHIDTSHLKKHIDKIKPEDIISITKKLHGTSFVVAKILCNKKLSFFELLLSTAGVNINNKEYQTIWSSRNVVKNANRDLAFGERIVNQVRFWVKNPSYFISDLKHSLTHPIKNIKGLYYSSSINHNHFYSYDLWEDIAKKIEYALVDGITLYGEAVGYTKDHKYIQKPYDYGCDLGEFKVYIYRITFTNPSGYSIELSAQQTKSYCEKYNLNYVPEIYHGKAKDLFPIEINDDWNNSFIKELSNQYLEKDCDICNNKVPAEGIVVRKEVPFEIEVYKHKSFRFFEHETKLLDSGEIDIETAESLVEQQLDDNV